eukprot:6181039-Pleurochrysis_carterae.AAC.2
MDSRCADVRHLVTWPKSAPARISLIRCALTSHVERCRCTSLIIDSNKQYDKHETAFSIQSRMATH